VWKIFFRHHLTPNFWFPPPSLSPLPFLLPVFTLVSLLLAVLTFTPEHTATYCDTLHIMMMIAIIIVLEEMMQ